MIDQAEMQRIEHVKKRGGRKMIDQAELLRLEHIRRLYRVMLEDNLKRQRDLKYDEAMLRTKLVRAENDKYQLLHLSGEVTEREM